MMIVVALGLFKAAALKRVEDFNPSRDSADEWDCLSDK
jgi:hypothetical protein